MAAIGPDAVRALAAAVESFDRPDASAAFIEALRQVVPFRSAIGVVFRREAAPAYVFDTFQEPAAKEALQRYVASTYVLNPVYNAFRAGLAPGVYRMRDLSPDAYDQSDLNRTLEVRLTAQEETGYITRGWPEGMEELVIAIGLPDGALGDIGLSRLKAEGGFEERCLDDLRGAFPLLAAIFTRLWSGLRQAARAPAREIRLGGFGDGLLTQRERDVALMILKGHSSESIALNLGVSLATVKTHRQRLYAKLGISSQGELFARFMVGQG